ncbi:MAG: YitT family protein [Lactobacillus sp.]|nr:YitT family protein [Lactobacillus sp.]
MDRQIHKHAWFRWGVFVIALEIIAISINYFYAPAGIAAGGTTGLAILLDAAFKFNRPLVVFVANTFMIVLAYFFLDKKTVKNIALGSYLLPLLMYITPSAQLTKSMLLAVTYGGALMGLGVALLYRVNASSGGTTVPPMILKKYFYINPSASLLAIDLCIIVANIFTDSVEAMLMAAFSQVVTTLVMRYTESGLDHKYQVKIMSNDHFDEIKQMLKEDYAGLTIFNVVGGYSNDSKQQLLIIVDTRDYGHLIYRIHEIDPDAFIVSSNVMNVHGGRLGM